MKKLVLIVAFVLLGACDSNRDAMEEMVRAQLKDPESATFGDYKEVLSKNRDWACLAVNAKNSFGGYTGEQSARFVRKAGEAAWALDSIAPQSFADCVKMLNDMQPYEGGSR